MVCTEKSEKETLDWLRKNLDEQRFLHSLGCAKTAKELAIKYKLDVEKAYLAGLLHDCAKCFEKEKMVKIARDLKLEDGELNNYKILHAPVSAYVAQSEFGIKDKEILSAIRWHTLGKMCMSTFEKIIFLADKIEPNTRDAEYIKQFALLLNQEDGLDLSILQCYKETINSLVRRDLKICQTTIDIYNSLLG